MIHDQIFRAASIALELYTQNLVGKYVPAKKRLLGSKQRAIRVFQIDSLKRPCHRLVSIFGVVALRARLW
jgi:hypothetical protein